MRLLFILCLVLLPLVACDSPIVDRSTTVVPEPPQQRIVIQGNAVQVVAPTPQRQIDVSDESSPCEQISRVTWEVKYEGARVPGGFLPGGCLLSGTIDVPTFGVAYVVEHKVYDLAGNLAGSETFSVVVALG